MPLLIWIKGPKGPEPQLIFNELVNGAGKSRVTALREVPITDAESELGLHALARLYPYTGEE